MNHLKRIFIFAWLLSLVVACSAPGLKIQAPLTNGKLLCQSSDRYLSSSSDNSKACIDLFQSDSVRPESIRRAVGQINNFFAELKSEYGFDCQNFDDYTTRPLNEWSIGMKLYIGARLYEAYDAGSVKHALLLKLGYVVDELEAKEYLGPQKNLKHIKVLRPPSDFSILYKNIYELIAAAADARKFGNEDIILPAFVFERTVAGEREYRLVRPGFDVMPLKSEGWGLPGSYPELDKETFTREISKGRMVLETKMFHHDLSHLLDYLSTPGLMPLHRKYFHQEHQAILENARTPSPTEAGMYLNEFLMFPSLDKKNRFHQIFAINSAPPGSPNRFVELQDELDSGFLLKKIDQLEQDFMVLFQIHGGGSMDGRSLDVFPNHSGKFMDILKKKITGFSSRPSSSIDHFLANDSFWGLMKQMACLKAVLLNDKDKLISSGVHFEDLLLLRNDAANLVKIKKALVDLMARFELQVTLALSNRMSAEQLFKDIVSSVDMSQFKNTKSYRYFRSYSVAGSLEAETFIDGRFRSR